MTELQDQTDALLEGLVWGDEATRMGVDTPVAQADESYALLVDHSFNGTLHVWIWRKGTRVELAAKCWYGFDEPGEAVKNRKVHRPLSWSDWEDLQASLRRANFWALPQGGEVSGLDGETWHIAGRRGATSHHVWRWCPGSRSYRALGMLFAELAGLGTPENHPSS
jgi:hypothetical protein